MSCFHRSILILVTAAVLASTALADINNQTVVLSSGTHLNLDSGATASSGGDLSWTGTGLSPQGSAKAYDLGAQGDNGYNSTSQALIKSLVAGLGSSSTIPQSQMRVNEMIVVATNGGNYAKVEITAVTINGSMTVKFTTYGNTTGVAGNAPTITAVLNNSSRVPAGYPNYGIAPSSLFVIQGTGLADPGTPVLQDSTLGLPKTLNGASLSVTVNGTTTTPAIYYTSPTQIAAVMPAATPVGNATITVTYKGVPSAAFPFTMVPAALGFTTYNGSALATDAVTGALLTYTQPGKPGEIIILWSTGLGSDPADSDTTYTSTPNQVKTNLQVFIGNTAASIAYQGASVYPGVSVLGVTIPQNVQTGCYVSLAAMTNNIVSNVTSIPISSDGNVCTDALTGLNGTQITQGGTTTLKTGTVAVFQTTGTGPKGTVTSAGGASAAFVQVTGTFNTTAPAPGGCVLNSGTPASSFTGLNVGTITMTPSGGSPVTLPAVASGEYSTLLTAIPGATYRFQGSGGTQVGPFDTTVTMPSPAIAWTNQSAAVTINRAAGLTVMWTGGQPGTYINIIGGSAANGIVVGYNCLARVEDGQFTVPSYILLALPAGQGNAELINNSPYGTFSASGLDVASSFGTISVTQSSTYN